MSNLHENSKDQRLGECYRERGERAVTRLFEFWPRIPRQKVLKQ